MKIKTTQLDRIITSVPQNATAARVTGKGTHYEPTTLRLTPGYQSHDLPPPMRPIPPDTLKRCGHLVGKKIGLLTVIGLAEKKFADAAGWVVRCACGQYEFRKAKFLQNPQPAKPDDVSADRCVQCQHLQRIRRNYALLGSRSVEDFASPGVTRSAETSEAQAPGGAKRRVARDGSEAAGTPNSSCGGDSSPMSTR